MSKDKIMDILNDWHKNGEYQKIIDYILNMPRKDIKYQYIGRLASSYNNLEKYDKAIEELNYIKSQGMEDPLWHFRMGYSLFYKENYEEAKKEFELTLRLNPSDNDALDYIGEIKSIICKRNNGIIIDENKAAKNHKNNKWKSD